MAWIDIENEIRGRLAETSTSGFWTSLDLSRYFNDWLEIQHREIFQRALQAEVNGFGQAYENDYLKTYLRKLHYSMTPGRAEYDLPSNFWRMARVYIGMSPPVAAEAINLTEEYQVTLGGRKGPSPRRPLYSIIPDSSKPRIKFYLYGGDRTIPNAAWSYTIHYFTTPTRVDLSASPPINTDLPTAFQAAPKAGACFLALLKERTNGDSFRQEAMSHIATAVPAPSVETK